MRKLFTILMLLSALFILAYINIAVAKESYDKLIIGVWTNTGSECNKKGSECKQTSGSPIEFRNDGQVIFGKISQSFQLNGAPFI